MITYKSMKHIKIIGVFYLALCLPAWAQYRATMTAPVIRPSTDEVVFNSEFSDFVPGADYRLGVGTAGGKVTSLKIELLKNDAVVKKNPVSFVQGYTSSWWDVDKVSIRGFVLARDELPEKGKKVRLKITLPRAEADKLKKIYILVARKYGTDRWYVEDGVELLGDSDF